MKKYLIILIFLSFAQSSIGQSSFFANFYYQYLSTPGIYSANGMAFELGYLKSSEKPLSLYANLNVDLWPYSSTNRIKEPSPTESYQQDLRVKSLSKAFSIGLGPTLQIPVDEYARFRIESTLQFAHIESSVNYFDIRTDLQYKGGSRFDFWRETELSKEQRFARSNSLYMRIKAGFDYYDMTVPAGIDIGWQNLNYGETMNAINPSKRFASEKFNLRSSIWFVGLRIYLQ